MSGTIPKRNSFHHKTQIKMNKSDFIREEDFFFFLIIWERNLGGKMIQLIWGSRESTNRCVAEEKINQATIFY